MRFIKVSFFVLAFLLAFKCTYISAQELHFPPDFRDETIYSVITTRFYDGDSENNFFNRIRIDQTDPHWRGDFKGLIERLDYIKELGFTCLCITPPEENRGELDFMGFHPYDWMKQDPRLISENATYQDLLDKAHEKGLKVIQTVVLNHSSNYGIRNQFFISRLPLKFYVGDMKPTHPYVFNFGNYKHPYRMDNDNPCAPEWFKDFLVRDPWAAGPLIDPKTGTTLPQENYDPQRFFGTDENDLDRNWFHKSGWFSATENLIAFSVQNKHLDTNSIDLATENYKVKNYLNAAIKKLISMRIDGLRIQFARNIPRYDLLIMLEQWKKLKPELYVFADVQPSGTGFGELDNDTEASKLTPWWYSRTGNLPKEPDSGKDSGLRVMDYPLFKSLKETLTIGTFSGLDKIFAFDYSYGNSLELITFFHNYDQGPETGNLTRFSAESWKAANAYSFLWTMRGIPMLLYGEEVEFKKGLPMIPVTPEDTLNMTGKAYFGETISDTNINDAINHSMFRHIKRLNQLRKAIPALRKGRLENGKEWGSGMSFVRNYNNGQSYAIVGLAVFVDQSITVTQIPSGSYTDAITGITQTVATDTLSLTFNVKANSAGIWVKNGPGKIGEDGEYLR